MQVVHPLDSQFERNDFMGVLSRLKRRTEQEALPFNLSTQDLWGERAEVAARLWESHAGDGSRIVADLGAGNTRVRQLLKRPHTDYLAYDLLPQHELVNQLDVRLGLPRLHVDAALLLGVIEYIEPENKLFELLAEFAHQVVVSYVPLDTGGLSVDVRAGQLGWMRHETKAATEQRFRSAGFRLIAETSTADGVTTIWLWERQRQAADRRAHGTTRSASGA